MTQSEIVSSVNKYKWYHRVDLGNGFATPGHNPLDIDSYRVPLDLTGKRVLDIGAWDGFWTFEALKRGASQVIAIDDFSDHPFLKGKNEEWATFDLCKKILGYSDEQCQRYEMNLYELSPETFGMFDVVFMFGVLYHCRHPLLALDIAASVCSSEIYVESAILDNYTPYNGGFSSKFENEMLMEFYPKNELGNNFTNWWSPTLICMANMTASAGFPTVEYWKLSSEPADVKSCRGFVRGVK